MSRKILINGQRSEEVRVAIVNNNNILEDFEIEAKSSGLRRNNIYRATVTNIAPSLNAAFVDFGDAKNGFLSFNDLVESYYARQPRDPAKAKISEVLTAGQRLIVQVTKDAQDQKGAQVTTNISLAGRYVVLRPKDAKSGISRKVDDDARADLAQQVKDLNLPEGCGCIIRTNAADQPNSILKRDVQALLRLWNKIDAEFEKAGNPKLLYNDQDLVIQIMRDYLDTNVSEVLIDDEECFERAQNYVRAYMPGSENIIKKYNDRTPLFTKFNIEAQIARIFSRKVKLPSGGFIVIDPTEALTAIDVNSAKSTKKDNQDLTAFHTNKEAAIEIARQLRLRDIGGLIVIDFIDMRNPKDQREIERIMREAMSNDKARNRVERISANGLLEINRQRIRQALSLRTQSSCPTCEGRGFVLNTDMFGLNLLRQIEARAVEHGIGGATVKLHPEMAQAVQNQRRHDIFALEREFDIHIDIIASPDMSRSEEFIEWINAPKHKISDNKSADLPMTVADTIQELSSIRETIDTPQNNIGQYDLFNSEEARKRRHERRKGAKNEHFEAESDIVAPGILSALKMTFKKYRKSDPIRSADTKNAKNTAVIDRDEEETKLRERSDNPAFNDDKHRKHRKTSSENNNQTTESSDNFAFSKKERKRRHERPEYSDKFVSDEPNFEIVQDDLPVNNTLLAPEISAEQTPVEQPERTERQERRQRRQRAFREESETPARSETSTPTIPTPSATLGEIKEVVEEESRRVDSPVRERKQRRERIASKQPETPIAENTIAEKENIPSEKRERKRRRSRITDMLIGNTDNFEKNENILPVPDAVETLASETPNGRERKKRRSKISEKSEISVEPQTNDLREADNETQSIISTSTDNNRNRKSRRNRISDTNHVPETTVENNANKTQTLEPETKTSDDTPVVATDTPITSIDATDAKNATDTASNDTQEKTTASAKSRGRKRKIERSDTIATDDAQNTATQNTRNDKAEEIAEETQSTNKRKRNKKTETDDKSVKNESDEITTDKPKRTRKNAKKKDSE